ncbi:MAG: 2-C-methyl-D-erythritol 4-phosphate cytidylyltransferase [Bacteroidales bacterium]|nr:2-C-methyl-D-erythritol 4-phosphate cytidylyltransferase [Bacteroidales bacterium]
MKRYVIITAGGTGTRMGADRPKQLLELEGKPVLRRTIELFQRLSTPVEIIVVMNESIREEWKDYCRQAQFRVRHRLVTGGITRFHSVKNGLKYVEPGALVAVHDAVRPFATVDMIEAAFRLAEEEGSAIPYVDVVDSLRSRKPDSNGRLLTEPVDRSLFLGVQTPQIFRSDWLLEAYVRPYQTSFTDDASVVEAAGHPLSFLPGSRFNIKLTTPEDWQLAQLFISLPL